MFSYSNPQSRGISRGLFPYVLLPGNTVDISSLLGLQGSRIRKLTQGQICLRRKWKDKSLEVKFLDQRVYFFSEVCLALLIVAAYMYHDPHQQNIEKSEIHACAGCCYLGDHKVTGKETYGRHIYFSRGNFSSVIFLKQFSQVIPLESCRLDRNENLFTSQWNYFVRKVMLKYLRWPSTVQHRRRIGAAQRWNVLS